MVMVGSVCSDGGVCMRTSFDVWLLYLCTRNYHDAAR